MKPVIPTTHSKLTAFQLCPRRYFHQFVAMDIGDGDNENPMLAFGSREHSILEKYGKTARRTPTRLSKVFDYIDALRAQADQSGGKLLPEQSLAFDTEYKKCHWYKVDENVDNPILFRAKLDLMVLAEDYAIIIDYKTGKPKQDHIQLHRYALAAFIHYPKLQRIRPEFWFLQYNPDGIDYNDQPDPKATKHVRNVKRISLVEDLRSKGNWITRDRVPDIQRELAEDIEALQLQEHEDDWYPSPSMPFPCGYCPVNTCEHYDPVRK